MNKTLASTLIFIVGSIGIWTGIILTGVTDLAWAYVLILGCMLIIEG